MMQQKRRAFASICAIELWERFGFFGMAALLVLYMIGPLGFDDTRANLTWGAFGALVFSSPCIGGWIGDNILGPRRTMTCGALVLFLGYLLLVLGDTRQPLWLFAALGVVVVGNGLFKSNAANLIRRIYEGDGACLDRAFTLYYLSINIGATASILTTPWVKVNWGWNAAFAMCTLGMGLGILQLALMHRMLAHAGSALDNTPVRRSALYAVIAGAIGLALASMLVLHSPGLAKAVVLLAALAIVAIFACMIASARSTERAGLLAAMVLMAQVVLFFIFYQQMSTSLTLFALRNVDPQMHLFGTALWKWSPAQFQALPAIWIMLLGPLLVMGYAALEKRHHDIPVAVKYMLGFAAVALGYLVFASSGRFAVDGRVSSWFMVWGYALYALGELLVSGLGLAMIARYAPARMGGFMMGAYFVATGVSQYLGSLVANFAKVPSGDLPAQQSLPLYIRLFEGLGWTAAGGMVIALLLLPLMRRLSHAHQQGTSAI